MNAIAMTFATALASVAAAAAIGVGLANGTAGTADAAGATVLGPRAEVRVVARLPRVVVEHRRTAVAAAPAQVRPS